jgi:hypothetical protein
MVFGWSARFSRPRGGAPRPAVRCAVSVRAGPSATGERHASPAKRAADRREIDVGAVLQIDAGTAAVAFGTVMVSGAMRSAVCGAVSSAGKKGPPTLRPASAMVASAAPNAGFEAMVSMLHVPALQPQTSPP